MYLTSVAISIIVENIDHAAFSSNVTGIINCVNFVGMFFSFCFLKCS